MASVKFSWEGPRWVGAEDFIRGLAFQYDLTVDHLDCKKHWFTETGRAKLSGEDAAIRRAWNIWRRAVKDYNQ